MQRHSPDEVEPLLNEQQDHRSPIVSPSPFARYLSQENQQRRMRENITSFQSDRDLGKVSRFFNNFADEYDGINPLTLCLQEVKEQIRQGLLADADRFATERAKKGENDDLRQQRIAREAAEKTAFRVWLDILLAFAIDELFDENGEYKEDILAALVSAGLTQEDLNQSPDKFKWQLVASYIVNIVGGSRAAVLGFDALDFAIEDRVATNIYGVFSSAINHQAKIVDSEYGKLDGDCIDKLHKRIDRRIPSIESSFPQIANANKQFDVAYDNARLALEQSIANENNDAALRDQGRKIKEKIEDVKNNNDRTSYSTKMQLAKAMRASKNVIDDPDDVDKINTLTREAKSVAKRSVGKIIGGLMLGLAGIALIGISVTAAVLSHGLSTPLSLYGIKLGITTIGIGIGIASAAGLGASIGGGALIFSGAKKKPVRKEMEKLAEMARKPRLI